MKTYQELSEEDRKKAREYHLTVLLTGIIEGAITFEGELEVKIQKALRAAAENQTPWFSHEYIIDTCKEELENIALQDAQEDIYLEDHEIMPTRLPAGPASSAAK